jgi:hypothetical protein
LHIDGVGNLVALVGDQDGFASRLRDRGQEDGKVQAKAGRDDQDAIAEGADALGDARCFVALRHDAHIVFQ